ncbi:MAG: NADH-quinone oxidoreductase subunit NuoH [Coriobacteriia bacterium]|nr:NADH-quinone oxidoreductase subunit NuoH [Coriobacteriia bacterium]
MSLTGFLGGAVWGLAAGVAVAVATVLGVWGERKVSARIQRRYGPQEAGPFGLLQLPYDFVKLLTKEDVLPRQASPGVFRMAPLLVTTPILMSLVVVPLAMTSGNEGWAPVDSSVGMLFFLAVPSIAVLGVLLGGWSSRNTYATLGGLRAAAQMISYELPRSLAVLSIVLLAGSLRPLAVLSEWRVWWLPLTFIGFVVFFIASLAELNRGPFDLPEAESELVAGYFADYSGMRWALFMMAEYGGALATSLFAAVVFFGGGWPLTGAAGVAVLIVKAVVLTVAMMWVKWTFPRMRPDQLMTTAWKVLTPLALVQLLIVGVVIPWL